MVSPGRMVLTSSVTSWLEPLFRRTAEFRVRSGCLRSRDEVDELLHAGQEGRLEVGVAAHPSEDPLPGQRDVRLAVVRPAERRADPVLPVLAAGDDRPRVQSEPGGAYRLPHVDVGVAQDLDVSAGSRQCPDGVDDPGLLGPGNEVVDEDTHPATRAGTELGDRR